MATKVKKRSGRELIWTIYDPQQTKKLAADLKNALLKNKPQAVVELLSDTRLLRSLVVRRGEGGEYLLLIERSFQFWLSGRTNQQALIKDIKIEKLLKILGQAGISEQIFNELAHVYFHLRNEPDFLSITKYIIDHADFFQNQAVVARAHHDLGSWHNVHGRLAEAMSENKIALTMAREIGEPVIEAKARFGLSHSKGNVAGDRSLKVLKPSALLADFSALADQLDKLGVFYDAIRARIEAARALIILARRREKQDKKDLLLTAKNLSLAALYSAKDHEYPNAEILARENLSAIYAEVKEARKERSYFKGAIDLRDKYKYQGKHLILGIK